MVKATKPAKSEPDRRVVLSREEVETAQYWGISLVDFAKAKVNGPNACDEQSVVWPM